MDFSKMTRDDKIEVCFKKILDHDEIIDKIKKSASGVKQAKASIKQNMKRNETVIFNAMLDTLSMVLWERENSAKRNNRIKKEKDREIKNLQLRLSDVEYKMKLLEQTIKEQQDWIELFKASHNLK